MRKAEWDKDPSVDEENDIQFHFGLFSAIIGLSAADRNTCTFLQALTCNILMNVITTD